MNLLHFNYDSMVNLRVNKEYVIVSDKFNIKDESNSLCVQYFEVENL